MISDQSCSRVEGKDRIEDTLADCKEKLDFEKRNIATKRINSVLSNEHSVIYFS